MLIYLLASFRQYYRESRFNFLDDEGNSVLHLVAKQNCGELSVHFCHILFNFNKLLFINELLPRKNNEGLTPIFLAV